MYFNLYDGKLTCGDCSKVGEIDNIIKLSPDILNAVRYISLIDYKKLYNIRLPDNLRAELSEITENYVSVQLGKRFKTLDFYKTIISQ